jgi:hypothetical protein
MKSIPTKVHEQISKLAGAVDDAADAVRLAVDDLNDALRTQLASLETARNAYNVAIADFRGVYQDLHTAAEEYFNERSERWQQSDQGSEYAGWVNDLLQAAEELADLDEIEVDEFDEPELFSSDGFEYPADAPR